MSHHLLRAVMGLLIMYLFFMELQFFSARNAPGGMFASTILMCCYWFLTFVGSLHFSVAIVEEKEEETLPLLRMTGASAFSILLGKSLPRLAVALLFLLTITPFLMLSLTFGGVLPSGLLSAILGILCYAVLLSQIGLFSSVICSTAPRAFMVTAILWSFAEFPEAWLIIVAGLCDAILSAFGEPRLIREQLDMVSPFLQSASLLNNLSGTLLEFSLADVWRPQMTIQLIEAALLFVASWAVFERFTSSSGAAASATVAAAGGASKQSADRTSPTAPATAERSLPRRNGRFSQRVWKDALAWKAWQHIAGGQRWLWLRLIGIPLTILTSILVLGVAFDGLPDSDEVAGILTWFGMILFVINAARIFGRVLNREIYEKTLSSLLMLPQTTSQTVTSLTKGLMPGTVAGGSGLIFGCVLLLMTGSGSSGSDLLEFFTNIWFLQLVGWFVLTIYLGVLLSTWQKYGAMIVAFALLWIGTPVFCVFSGSLFVFAGGGRDLEDFFEFLLPLLLILIEVTLCVVIHRMICRRLEQLAGE